MSFGFYEGFSGNESRNRISICLNGTVRVSTNKSGNDVQNANALNAVSRFAKCLASALWYLLYSDATKIYSSMYIATRQDRYTITTKLSNSP